MMEREILNHKMEFNKGISAAQMIISGARIGIRGAQILPNSTQKDKIFNLNGK